MKTQRAQRILRVLVPRVDGPSYQDDASRAKPVVSRMYVHMKPTIKKMSREGRCDVT